MPNLAYAGTLAPREWAQVFVKIAASWCWAVRSCLPNERLTKFFFWATFEPSWRGDLFNKTRI